MRLKIARQDRRRALNRRVAERRQLAERRVILNRRRQRRSRITPTPFSAQQMDEIRRDFANSEVRFACPACKGSFTLGRGRRRGNETLRRIQCVRCGKSAVVAGDTRIRILVIAEKLSVRESIRRTLTEFGHEVVDAADASVALWAYQQDPTDVVFIDVLAAGRLDSGEFIRQVRKYAPDARVVAVSGRTSYRGPDPLRVARQLGALHTIRAPFSRTELLEVIEVTRSG
jgi:CheY-like chemotaxis protein